MITQAAARHTAEPATRCAAKRSCLNMIYTPCVPPRILSAQYSRRQTIVKLIATKEFVASQVQMRSLIRLHSLACRMKQNVIDQLRKAIHESGRLNLKSPMAPAWIKAPSAVSFKASAD
jgi:hypothetical protein